MNFNWLLNLLQPQPAVSKPVVNSTPKNASFPVASSIDGGVKYSGGQTVRSTPTNAIPANNPTGFVLPQGSNNQGQVLGTKDGGGGNRSPSDADFDKYGVARGDVGGYNRVLQEQQAQMERDRVAQELADRAYRGKVDTYKNQAGSLRNQGGRVFEDILKAIGSFRDRAGTLKDNALQEITNRGADILGTNAQNAQGLMGKAVGRARNMGLSGRMNLGNELLSNLQGMQGNTIAKRGEEERANSGLYQERMDQAQDQERQAGTYKTGMEEQAGNLERAGYDSAETSLLSNLNEIQNYNRMLASMNPVSATGLAQYSPAYSGLSNTLNSVLSGGGTTGGVSQVNQGVGNAYNPVDLQALLRKRQGLYQA